VSSVDPGSFYCSRVCGKIFHTNEPGQARGQNYSGHKQKRYVHVRVTADVAKQPEGLHVAQRVYDENVYGKGGRAHGRQRDVGQRRV